jgi:hypothetical protein
MAGKRAPEKRTFGEISPCRAGGIGPGVTVADRMPAATKNHRR